MSADAETLAFLTKDPEGFLAYFVESSDAVGLAYPEWFVTHGKIVAGIYGM